MQVTGINQQNKQSFGTVFVRINLAEMKKSPKLAEINRLITDTLEFKSGNCVITETSDMRLLERDGKWQKLRHSTNRLGISLENSPEEENIFVEGLKKLFDLGEIETKIIPNTPENELLIRVEQSNLDDWVDKWNFFLNNNREVL